MAGTGRFEASLLEHIRAAPRRSDVAHQAVRRAILSHTIQPGEWLREEVLAVELGVSRTPIREVLARLVADGLAVQHPFKGVTVVAVPVEEIEQVHSLRAMLEGEAMRLAVGRISPTDLARMEDLLPRASLYVDLQLLDDTVTVNQDFHWVAIKACGQRHLIHLLEYLWGLAAIDVLSGTVSESDRAALEQADYVSHRALLDALAAGDGLRASEIDSQHILRQLQYTRRLPDAPV